MTATTPQCKVDGAPVAWRYKCADGQFVFMEARLTDEQKASGYYRDEEDDFDLDDDADRGPFQWSDETPLFAALPESTGGMVNSALIDPLSETQRTSSDLLGLADRCEKAAGPDRQLDLDIVNAISAKPGWFWHDDLHRTISRNDYGHGALGNPICSLDPHTSFIDHALELVPEGWRFELTTTGFKPGATLVTPRGTLVNGGGAYAATPALALCAAALRARATLQTSPAEPVASDDASRLGGVGTEGRTS